MPINVPSSISDLDTGDYVLGEAIVAPDWGEISDRLHYLYARHGGIGCGHVWDPPFQRTSTSLGVEPDGDTTRPLDHAHMPLQVVRTARGTDNNPITALVQTTDGKVEFELYRVNTQTSLATTSVSTTGTDWLAVSFNPTDAQLNTSASYDPVELRLRTAANDSNAPVRIRQAYWRAAILTASDMPTA